MLGGFIFCSCFHEATNKNGINLYVNHIKSRDYLLISFQLIREPHSLTVFEDYLYWTDRSTRQVNRCHKWNATKDQGTVVTGLYYVSDILSYHPVRQPDGT